MKKIKFLHGFVVILLLFLVLGFFPLFIAYDDFKGLLYVDFIITMCFSFCAIIGVFFIQRALYIIMQKGFFINSVGEKLKKGGLFFIITGLGRMIFNIIILIRKLDPNSSHFFSNVEYNLLLIITGFSLYIIADIIQNGSVLKQENELTI